MAGFTTIISHVWQKLLEIIQYPLGWLAGLLIFLLDSLSGGVLVLYLVTIASAIDLACGIAVSRKQKKFTLSELIRQTVEKLVVYGLALLAFLCIDRAIESRTDFDLALTSGLVGVIIAMAEIWSFLGSLLILFPKNPFLRLLQKALTGEIARKLGCSEEEVAQVLSEGKRKPKRDARGRFIKDTPDVCNNKNKVKKSK